MAHPSRPHPNHVMMRYTRALPFIVFLSTAATGACHRGAGVPGDGGTPMKRAIPSKSALPAGVDADLIARGDSIFHSPNASCQKCHGPEGLGGANAPSLSSGPWLQTAGSFIEINGIIVTGVPRDRIKDPAHRFQMNPRGGPMQLTDDQARAVAAYVWSISRRKTGP